MRTICALSMIVVVVFCVCCAKGGDQAEEQGSSASANTPAQVAEKYVTAIQSGGDAVSLVAAKTHITECSPETKRMFKAIKITEKRAALGFVLRSKVILDDYEVKRGEVTVSGKYAYVPFTLTPPKDSKKPPASGMLTLALEKGGWGAVWIEGTNALRGNAPEPPAVWLRPLK